MHLLDCYKVGLKSYFRTTSVGEIHSPSQCCRCSEIHYSKIPTFPYFGSMHRTGICCFNYFTTIAFTFIFQHFCDLKRVGLHFTCFSYHLSTRSDLDYCWYLKMVLVILVSMVGLANFVKLISFHCPSQPFKHSNYSRCTDVLYGSPSLGDYHCLFPLGVQIHRYSYS